MKEIQVLLDKSQYLPGDVLTGTITVETDSPFEPTAMKVSVFTISGIQSNLTGQAINYVTLKYKPRYYPETPPSMIEEIQIPIEKRVIPSGFHTFPFYLSPFRNDSSPTFEANDLYVRYFVEAQLETKSKETLRKRESFIMVYYHDLNRNEAAKKMLVLKKAKIVGLPVKKVTVEVSVPAGICYGHTLPINIKIKNHTKMPNYVVRSKLMSKFHLFIAANQLEREIVAENVEEVHVAPGANRTVSHTLKNIRSLVTCYSPLLSVTSTLEVEVETSNSQCIKFEFPIIVGTAPIFQGPAIVPTVAPSAPPMPAESDSHPRSQAVYNEFVNRLSRPVSIEPVYAPVYVGT